ncbi:hypothetical protein J7F03_38950 [Streptomyces sp. ISL-43]|uniref:hypothetical protein n=1 Tax=Streptomyces sp. ISL-43 TaxID=2819183 RepID=UPI001BEA02E0|nr:hypothetical protein [Streptomyces sp. ISL-43]MBT2452913.1 hypothetical protein [Streptomyces sp. ISL-43]
MACPRPAGRSPRPSRREAGHSRAPALPAGRSPHPAVQRQQVLERLVLQAADMEANEAGLGRLRTKAGKEPTRY